MPFKPGESGNPKGRTPKPRAGPDKLRANLLGQAPAILAALIEAAKSGDPQASKLILDRCLPALRPADRPITLPLGPDLAEAGRATLSALADGRLTPEQASSVASTINTLARSNALIEVEGRLTAIEALLNERRQ